MGVGDNRRSPKTLQRKAWRRKKARLRKKIEALPLRENQTIADAAKADPRLADAVSRTLARAKATKVDYDADGAARVRLTLQLGDLWDAIAAER